MVESKREGGIRCFECMHFHIHITLEKVSHFQTPYIFSQGGEHGSQDVLNRVIFLGIQSSYISYDYVIFFFYMGFICHYWTFLFPTIYVTFHTITIIIVIILVTILLFIVY